MNILIVVDMQQGFIKSERMSALEMRILDLLKSGTFDKVIATRYQNSRNSTYEKLLSWSSMETAEEQRLANHYRDYVDLVVDKSIYTCVDGNFLQSLCRLNGGSYPETVYLVGADTDCCVLTIATGLFEHNIRPVVLTRYCDSAGGPKSHEAGITCMARLIGERQLVDKCIDSRGDLVGI